MYGTYLFLRNQALKDKMEAPLEQLVQEYNQKKDDRLVATVFIRVYGIAKSCTDRYYSIPNQDKESLALEYLLDAMGRYSQNCGMKFCNFYRRVLNGKCQDWVSKQNHKYDGIDCALSIEALCSEYAWEPPTYDSYSISNVLKNRNLGRNELRFCELVMNESHEMTITEIAKELGMSRTGVYLLIKRLKELFKDLHKA